jgi:hypothetical protein
MSIQVAFLLVALVLFALGMLSRWYGPAERPYWPTMLSAGLFFWVLSVLWPLITAK